MLTHPSPNSTESHHLNRYTYTFLYLPKAPSLNPLTIAPHHTMKEILPTSSGGPSQPPSQTQTNDQNEEIAMLIYETLNPWTEPDWAPFYNTYKAMHENPGVSGDEGFAADKATAFLESVRGMHVVRDIGRNERRGVGPSVVGVFRNAADGEDVNGGKVVLLRADMDALPVREDTG